MATQKLKQETKPTPKPKTVLTVEDALAVSYAGKILRGAKAPIPGNVSFRLSKLFKAADEVQAEYSQEYIQLGNRYGGKLVQALGRFVFDKEQQAEKEQFEKEAADLLKEPSGIELPEIPLSAFNSANVPVEFFEYMDGFIIETK